jgi:hypothetical protein
MPTTPTLWHLALMMQQLLQMPYPNGNIILQRMTRDKITRDMDIARDEVQWLVYWAGRARRCRNGRERAAFVLTTTVFRWLYSPMGPMAKPPAFLATSMDS